LSFERQLSTKLLENMPVRLRTREAHKFDLVANDEKVAIECKSHAWTKSDDYPSAKATDAQPVIELLHKSLAERKIIAFQDVRGCHEGN
jgi:predicted metal-dependent peptidase